MLRSFSTRVSAPLLQRRRPRACSSLSALDHRLRKIIVPPISRELHARQPSDRVDPQFLVKDPESDLFNYTHGRFLANDSLHVQERKRAFNIPGLFEIVSTAMICKVEQIVNFQKLAEGRLNRLFLITLDNGFRLVARIPYPFVVPKAYALASEVATMDFLRSKGLPIPKVYGYSFSSKNEAETEYILMEYIEGSDLSETWFSLNEGEIIALMEQLAKLESVMMSISFPAGGSIYYARDLKALSGNNGIPLKNEIESVTHGRFCLGPDVSAAFWHGKREHMDVFRGPYNDVESVLVAGANKELAYLHQFGSPRAPYERMRREHYKFQKQSSMDHVKNLNLYLSIAPSLVPKAKALSRFCIRHPDINPGNIKVSSGSDGLQIVSLLDWQHTLVLPLFLISGVPSRIQQENDEASAMLEASKGDGESRGTVFPELPGNFDNLSQSQQEKERGLLRRRRVYLYYNLFSMTHNDAHGKGLGYRMGDLSRHIVEHSAKVWDGETIGLLNALMKVVSDWKSFTKDPCPVSFMKDEKAAAKKLYRDIVGTQNNEAALRGTLGCEKDTWVPAENYEEAKALAKKIKRDVLDSCRNDPETSEKMYALIEANWPYDDMDEAEMEDYT